MYEHERECEVRVYLTSLGVHGNFQIQHGPKNFSSIRSVWANRLSISIRQCMFFHVLISFSSPLFAPSRSIFDIYKKNRKRERNEQRQPAANRAQPRQEKAEEKRRKTKKKEEKRRVNWSVNAFWWIIILTCSWMFCVCSYFHHIFISNNLIKQPSPVLPIRIGLPSTSQQHNP